MHEHIGLLIASARRRIKQAVLARAAEHRLAPQQFWFLVALFETPKISQVELADRLHADAPTASRVITELIRRRLVKAEVDEADRRRLRLSLTTTGKKLATELSTIAREIRSAVVAGMTMTEQEALRRSLIHVISNIDRLHLHSQRANSRVRGQS